MHSPRQAGQSLVETCLVIALISLIFFGLFQVSQVIAAKEVLGYSAGRGLRAKTVGFNWFMVYKTTRVGAIPIAGRLTEPTWTGGPRTEHAHETPRIPLYLGSRQWGDLDAILNYADWKTVWFAPPGVAPDGTLHMDVTQDMPLKFAMHRAFYADDSVHLTGESSLDDHYPLYLEDWGL